MCEVCEILADISASKTSNLMKSMNLHLNTNKGSMMIKDDKGCINSE